MYYQSIAPVWSQTFTLSVLNAFGARPAAALMPQTIISLFTSGPPVLQPGNISSLNFVEANFPGYTRQNVLNVTHPVAFSNGAGWGIHASTLWVASSAITQPGQTVLGYWVAGTGSRFWCAEYFPQPFTFANPFDYLALTWVFGLAFAPIVGNPVTSPAIP